MLASLRLRCQATLLTTKLILLGLLFLPQNAFANDPLRPSADPWIVKECSAQASQVQLLHDSRQTFKQDRPTVVITHGMGGTELEQLQFTILLRQFLDCGTVWFAIRCIDVGILKSNHDFTEINFIHENGYPQFHRALT